MALEREHLVELATAISDGESLDWDTIESSARTDQDRALIRELRILSGLAAIHRQHSDAVRSPGDAGATSDAEAATQTAPATLGTWGDLTLMTRLGGGAFGDVYQAWDPKLAREVALKLLRRRPSAGDVEALVINEGRLLARVRHPNVVTVFGADRIDGRVGLWMDYIKGRTLEQIVRQQGPFGADEAAVVGVDLCRALAAVHAAGLVHGDIKAHNVMREDGGRIVLMDFGAGRELATRQGDAAADGAGTPIYMAPELFRGAEPSVRSDIYSLGVLLDHLVTGSYPVAARTSADVRAAHAKGERRLLRDARPDLPAAFIQVVERATSPDPQERFASAGAMEAALTRGLDVPVSRKERTSTRFWFAAAAALALVAGVWAWRSTTRQPTPTAGAAVVRSLAVLPFVNSAGADEEYFSDGTTELLTARLSKIGSLKVISHTSTLRYKGTQRTPVDIAADLKVDALLSGSIAKSRDRVRLSAQIIQAGTGQLLWADSYERQLTDYFVLQSDLVRDVVRNIRVALSPDQAASLAEQATSQPEAQDAYLKGAAAMQSFSESGLRAAIDHFKRAIELDPRYARAYASLAQAYALLGPGYKAMPRDESYALTREAAAKALELDERLNAAHYAMSFVKFDFEFDWPAAEAHLRRALELSPSDANAHQHYGTYLSAMGDREGSIRELRLARELDPFLTERRSELAMVLYYARRYEEALAELQSGSQIDPQFEMFRFGLARVYDAMQRPREALGELESLRERNDSAKQAELARVRARLGDVKQARTLLSALEDARRQAASAVAPESLAHVYVALKEPDRALALLEEGFAGRSPGLCWLKVDPRFDDLRADARFTNLLARLRLDR
jgi:serine/threonine-protein kinase